MILHFSHAFDGIVYAPPQPARAGEWYAGPYSLLQWLEAQTGRSGYAKNTDYLRIEWYRQALGQLLEVSRKPLFYEKSFLADRFATAETLLAWRDELLMAGWNFQYENTLPERLAVFAELEQIYQEKRKAPGMHAQSSGMADRLDAVLQALSIRRIQLNHIFLYEPLELQIPVIQRIIKALIAQNIPVSVVQISGNAPAETLLGQFQNGRTIQSGTKETPPRSLGILRARRDSDAALFLAQALRETPRFQPVFLLPEMDLLLEQNLVNEGFAPMGVLSSSLARPSLQALKLAPAFLWEPVDVFKIMEFVTLPLKPLDQGLSFEIARVMAEKPGMFSDAWYATVFSYLEQADIPEKARQQYEFWFDRRRYPADRSAPKRDAIALYAYLQEWAYEESANNASLMVLAEQARRIRELLETLPEQRIGFLELERIVRTIYEPSPLQLSEATSGSFAYAHQPGAFATSVEDLVWWNCIFENNTPTPDKWQQQERTYLENLGISLETTRVQRMRRQHLQCRPLLQTSRSLLLVIPDQVDGAEAVPSLIYGDLEAIFGAETLRDFTFRVENEEDRARFANWLKSPEKAVLTTRPPGRPPARLQITPSEMPGENAYETPTQLENLFYYPHRWFFRQKLKLFRTHLLRVTGDTTLLGSLAHRFFEKLLQQDLTRLQRADIYAWVDQEAGDLLPREGATLLLYGREPDRMAFLSRVKNAAWNLISLLRSNGWEVEQTEMELQGQLGGMPVKGKADLVLHRDHEKAIIDLKWSGAKRRKELIQNGEDLQLVLYAHLLPPPENWPHTAYFILDEGKMIARNNVAFKEAVVAGKSGDDHAAACAAIFEKMEKTYAWRMQQFKQGLLEIRTARTAPELEALYEGQLFDLLEMKEEDAKWDDYRTLLGM
ncbi:MAG: PD-(D/E)XK nuclease family protein [Saprospiraceae bacterium]|nr:PD-(D/E)XK nuclease family protein [Saprospiraceae bacterium]